MSMLNDGNMAESSDPRFQDMLDLGDEFSTDLLPDDLNLDTFGDPNASFQPDIDPAVVSRDPSQVQHIPQPSVEISSKQQQDIQAYAPSTSPNQPFGEHDVSISGVGAGPLPTGYGVQQPANVGSTLTDFTKRRNWSARVVEEIKDFLHILTPDGRIMYVSPSTKALTGYEPSSLVGKFMTSFIHQDDNSMYVREFNESIASGNPLRFYFRFRKADDTYAIFESHGHPHFSSDVSNFGGTSHSLGFCRGFFMIARPYPTRNAVLLDSFLEHKIENERLQKRIADLKREEQEDFHQQYTSPGASAAIPPRPSPAVSGSRTSMSPLDAAHPTQYQQQRHTSSGESNVPPSPQAYNGMPPPAKPQINNYALTQRNLDEALAASRPDSMNDKMMRYEGSNYLEGIEMLTGLRYRDGERSKGISTGAMSPMLIRGDGVTDPSGSHLRNGLDAAERHSNSPIGEDKKKKVKVNDEYVCTDCGTLDSPEWRRGPNGPKTLCNACGLRWAKQEKKRNGAMQQANNQNPNTSGAPPKPPATMGIGLPSGPKPASATMQPSTTQMGPPGSLHMTQGATDANGGHGGGSASTVKNSDTTQPSGSQFVPATGGTGAGSGLGNGGVAPSPATTGMGTQPPYAMMPPPGAHMNMPGNVSNPVEAMGRMGMPTAMSGGGQHNTNQSVSGMGFGPGSGMDVMGMMGRMGGGQQQQQQQGYADPGGGGGQS